MNQGATEDRLRQLRDAGDSFQKISPPAESLVGRAYGQAVPRASASDCARKCSGTQSVKRSNVETSSAHGVLGSVRLALAVASMWGRAADACHRYGWQCGQYPQDFSVRLRTLGRTDDLAVSLIVKGPDARRSQARGQ